MALDQIAQKQTQCAEQASALNQTLDCLEKMVAVLGEKLQPVRHQVPQPGALAAERAVESSIAPLAQYMKERNAQAKRLCVHVETLLNEVQC